MAVVWNNDCSVPRGLIRFRTNTPISEKSETEYLWSQMLHLTPSVIISAHRLIYSTFVSLSLTSWIISLESLGSVHGKNDGYRMIVVLKAVVPPMKLVKRHNSWYWLNKYCLRHDFPISCSHCLILPVFGQFVPLVMAVRCFRFAHHRLCRSSVPEFERTSKRDGNDNVHKESIGIYYRQWKEQ